MSARAYRVRIHDAGTMVPVDGTVDFTLDTQLAAPPSVPGQTIDPIRGRTRSRPWSVDVVDASGAITSHLGSAGGRMQLLARLVELQENVASAGWETLIVGRLAQLSEMDGPGLWQLQVEDERTIERNARIFLTSDTSQVYPIGFRYAFREFPAGSTQRMTVSAVRNNIVMLEVESMDDAGGPMLPEVGELIEADVKPEVSLRTNVTTGNFQTLRAVVSGTLREISTFGYWVNAANQIEPQMSLGWSNGMESPNPVGAILVVWPTSQPAVGAAVEVALVMPTHEPDEFLPLHLGVTDAGHDYGTAGGGIHPFDLVERLYDEAGVRYNAAAIDALKADNRYPRAYFRITESATLAEWLEDNIYGPLMVVPFINAMGEVAPRSVALQVDVNPDTLPILTAANLADHPTFLHTRREVVNRVVFKTQNLTSVPPAYLPTGTGHPGADGLRAFDYEFPRDHDNQATLGIFPIEVSLFGYHGRSGSLGFAGDSVSTTPRDRVADFFAAEVFDRFGDGPITGRVSGLSATAAVEPGDFVLIDLDTYPNPVDNARGSARIVQILQKDLTPYGPEFEYLDAGPYLQPLAEPSVVIAANADRPTNDVDVTLSSVPAGASATVQLAYNATEPAADSPLWFVARSGLANGTVTIPDNPTGAHVWARARAEAPGRIRSGWSAVDDVTLTGGASVRGLEVSFDGNGTPTVFWEASAGAAGVSIYYVIHPTALPSGALTDYGDADATLGQLKLTGVTVRRGEFITVEVEPWTGFAAGAVSGTAGPRERITEIRVFQLVPSSLYGFSRFEEVETGDPTIRQFEYEAGPLVHSVWAAVRQYDMPLTVDAEADIKPRVRNTGTLSGTITMPAPTADLATMYRAEPRYLDADGNLVVYDGGVDLVEMALLYAEPAKINGLIDARYDAGILKVFASANPTVSALPIAYEIREDSKTGSILASGSWTTQAAAQTGVGGTGTLTDLVPPADGKKFYLAKFTDIAGNEEWHADSIENPAKPRLAGFRPAPGATPLSTDAYITGISPLGRDIQLKVWTNKASNNDPDPAGAPDETLSQAFTAGTPGSVEFGPPATSLNDIAVYPGRAKKIYFQVVDELGLSSDIEAFTLPSFRSIMRADGTIIDDAIDRPAAFAASLRPPIVVGALPADNTDSNVVFLTTDYKLYRWDATAGAWTRSTDGADIIVDSILAGSIAAGAVGTSELAAGAATIGKLNVARVFVTGLTLTNNSPGAGSVAWSACQVQYEGTLHSVAGGNSANAIIWWDASTPNAFQTSTSNDDLIADGFDEKLGDAVIAINEGGAARQIWNGTLIYGDQIVTDAVKARHVDVVDLSAINADLGIIISGLIRDSSNTHGIRVDDDRALPGTWTSYLDLGSAGANALLKTPLVSINYDGSVLLGSLAGDYVQIDASGNVTISGALSAATGTFSGALSAATGTFEGVIVVDTAGLGNAIEFEHSGTPVASFATGSTFVALASTDSQLEIGTDATLLSSNDVILNVGGNLQFLNIPTTNPGGTGNVWKNGNALNIT